MVYCHICGNFAGVIVKRNQNTKQFVLLISRKDIVITYAITIKCLLKKQRACISLFNPGMFWGRRNSPKIPNSSSHKKITI